MVELLTMAESHFQQLLVDKKWILRRLIEFSAGSFASLETFDGVLNVDVLVRNCSLVPSLYELIVLSCAWYFVNVELWMVL